MARLKPLLPTLKEKKRYLAFEVISGKKIPFLDVSKAIWGAVHSFVGTAGAAAMGLMLLPEKYNNQKGIARIAHTSVDAFNASLALISRVQDEPVIVRSLGASGILQKAEQHKRRTHEE